MRWQQRCSLSVAPMHARSLELRIRQRTIRVRCTLADTSNVIFLLGQVIAMPTENELSLAVRAPNGQLASVSKGMTLNDLLNLVQKKLSQTTVLVDFQPLMHSIRLEYSAHKNEEINEEFGALLNSWQSSKSYTKESLRDNACHTLMMNAHRLLNKLMPRLQAQERQFTPWIYNHGKLEIAKSIVHDCGIYLQTLACLMLCQARIDAPSLKHDIAVEHYCSFIVDFIRKLYYYIIGYSEQRHLHYSSMLFGLALSRDDRVTALVKPIPDINPKELPYLYLGLVDIRAQSDIHYRDNGKDPAGNIYPPTPEPYTKVVIAWDNIDDEKVRAAGIFAKVFADALSVRGLLDTIKNSDVTVSSDQAAVDELLETATALLK